MTSIMISTNFEYLLTRPGLFKLLTLVFGVLTIGFGFKGVEGSIYPDITKDKLENELYFEFSTLGVFISSLVYLLILCFSDEITNSKSNRIFDTIYHAVAGKALIVGGILLISSAVYIAEEEEEQEIVCGKQLFKNMMTKTVQCQLHDFKILGATFALFNGLMYEVTAYFAYTTKDLT